MLKKILGNTLISVILVVLSVVYIIATFRMRTEWWMNFDMFFAFMAAFCHLMAALFTKMIPASMSNIKLDGSGNVVDYTWMRAKPVDMYGDAERLVKGGAGSIASISFA